MDTEYCHICSVEVPRGRYNAHQQSKRHGICLKMTKEAVRRVSEHITADFAPECEDTNKNHFCETCCIVINTADKILHYNSAGHLEKTLDDEQMNRLCSYYVNKDHPNLTVIDKTKKIKDLKAPERNNAYKSVDAEVQNNNKEVEVQMNEDKNMCEETENYVHDIKNKKAQDDNIVTKSEILVKKKKKKSKAKKNKLNYQLMKTDNPSKCHCKVCGIEIDNEINTLKSHLLNADHINAYEKMLHKNKIEKTMLVLVCHACSCEIAENTELDHIDSINHKNYLKSQEQSDFKHHSIGNNQVNKDNFNVENKSAGFTNTSDSKKCEQDKGNVSVEQLQNSVKDKNRKKAKQAFEIELEEARQRATQKLSATIQDIFILINPQTVLCQICKVPFPNKSSNIYTHLGSDNGHNESLLALLKPNGIMLSETSDNWNCTVCKVEVERIYFCAHLNTLAHKTNVRRAMEEEVKFKQHYITRWPNNLFCLICNKLLNIFNVQEPMSVHIHTLLDEHISTVAKILEKNMMTVCETDENGMVSYFCNACLVNVSRFDILTHSKNDNHVSCLRKYEKDEKQN